jgi:PD-(D/E)XK endonuclease
VRVDNPNHKGNVAELAIATEAARLGLSVLKPLTEHEPYDLVIGIADPLLRVQCKWGKRRGDVISVGLVRSFVLHRPETDSEPHYTSQTSTYSGL